MLILFGTLLIITVILADRVDDLSSELKFISFKDELNPIILGKRINFNSERVRLQLSDEFDTRLNKNDSPLSQILGLFSSHLNYNDARSSNLRLRNLIDSLLEQGSDALDLLKAIDTLDQYNQAFKNKAYINYQAIDTESLLEVFIKHGTAVMDVDNKKIVEPAFYPDVVLAILGDDSNDLLGLLDIYASAQGGVEIRVEKQDLEVFDTIAAKISKHIKEAKLKQKKDSVEVFQALKKSILSLKRSLAACSDFQDGNSNLAHQAISILWQTTIPQEAKALRDKFKIEDRTLTLMQRTNNQVSMKKRLLGFSRALVILSSMLCAGDHYMSEAKEADTNYDWQVLNRNPFSNMTEHPLAENEGFQLQNDLKKYLAEVKYVDYKSPRAFLATGLYQYNGNQKTDYLPRQMPKEPDPEKEMVMKTMTVLAKRSYEAGDTVFLPCFPYRNISAIKLEPSVPYTLKDNVLTVDQSVFDLEISYLTGSPNAAPEPFAMEASDNGLQISASDETKELFTSIRESEILDSESCKSFLDEYLRDFRLIENSPDLEESLSKLDDREFMTSILKVGERDDLVKHLAWLLQAQMPCGVVEGFLDPEADEEINFDDFDVQFAFYAQSPYSTEQLYVEYDPSKNLDPSRGIRLGKNIITALDVLVSNINNSTNDEDRIENIVTLKLVIDEIFKQKEKQESPESNNKSKNQQNKPENQQNNSTNKHRQERQKVEKRKVTKSDGNANGNSRKIEKLEESDFGRLMLDIAPLIKILKRILILIALILAGIKAYQARKKYLQGESDTFTRFLDQSAEGDKNIADNKEKLQELVDLLKNTANRVSRPDAKRIFRFFGTCSHLVSPFLRPRWEEFVDDLKELYMSDNLTSNNLEQVIRKYFASSKDLREVNNPDYIASRADWLAEEAKKEYQVLMKSIDLKPRFQTVPEQSTSIKELERSTTATRGLTVDSNGFEFDRHKNYHPGDSKRAIDWKKLAKMPKLDDLRSVREVPVKVFTDTSALTVNHESLPVNLLINTSSLSIRDTLKDLYKLLRFKAEYPCIELGSIVLSVNGRVVNSLDGERLSKGLQEARRRGDLDMLIKSIIKDIIALRGQKHIFLRQGSKAKTAEEAEDVHKGNFEKAIMNKWTEESIEHFNSLFEKSNLWQGTRGAEALMVLLLANDRQLKSGVFNSGQNFTQMEAALKGNKNDLALGYCD